MSRQASRLDAKKVVSWPKKREQRKIGIVSHLEA